MPIGKKRNLSMKLIPFNFINNDILKKEFISGFFDGDGSIFKLRDNRIGIDICQSEKNILEEIKIELGKEKININGPYPKTLGGYFLQTTNLYQIKKFIKFISPRYPKKLFYIKEVDRRGISGANLLNP